MPNTFTNFFSQISERFSHSHIYNTARTVKRPSKVGAAIIDKKFEWASLPIHNDEFIKVFKQHEDSETIPPHWLLMGPNLQKLNMMLEVPAMSSSIGVNRSQVKQFDEKPVSHEDFKAGKLPLRVSFNESPQARYFFYAKTLRTFNIGGNTYCHFGGTDTYINNSRRFIANETLTESVASEALYYYRCERPPLNYKIDSTGKARALAKFAANTGYTYESTGLSDSKKTQVLQDLLLYKLRKHDHALSKLDSFADDHNTLETYINQRNTTPDAPFDNPVSEPIAASVAAKLSPFDLFAPDNRDHNRDKTKPRSQVWKRFGGVLRLEAVQTDYLDKKVYVGDGKYVDMKFSRYKSGNGAMSDEEFQNPSLTWNSPHVLIEVRPQAISKEKNKTYDGLDLTVEPEIKGDDEAKLVMASPQFIFVGAKNPGTRQSNAETSGYDWSGSDPLATADKLKPAKFPKTIPSDQNIELDNVFGVKGSKDIYSCWKHAIPTEPEPKPDSATERSMNSFFGILGGEGLIKNGEIKNGVDGLELFGSKALVLGSGVKHKYETWQSSFSLTPDTISAKCFGNPKDPNDKSKGISALTVMPASFKLSLKKNKEESSIELSEMRMKLKFLESSVIELTKTLAQLNSKEIMLKGENLINLESGSAEFTLQDGKVDLKGNNVSCLAKKILLG